MIVFKEDWGAYPDAIADTKTRNKSFLQVCGLFKAMGVDHYYFPLALTQPRLQGVNPYDPDIDPVTSAAVLRECDSNIWYYLREVVRVPGGGETDEDKMFQANRGNIAAAWLLCASIDYIQIQPRQTGKSFGADCNTLWLMYFKYKKTNLTLITKDNKLRDRNITRLKEIRDEWPEYLNRNTKKDDNNQSSLTCKRLGNKLYTGTAQNSLKGAQNLGRGHTSPYIQVDEGPFITFIETTIVAALGSSTTARGVAAKKGYPYCNIFTTTAGKKDDRDGKFIYKKWLKAAPMDERFYDAKDRDELIRIIKVNGRRSIMVNLTLNHRQLGYDDDWLLERLDMIDADDADEINRDWFNLWTGGSNDSILDARLASIIRDSVVNDYRSELTTDKYILRWYREIDPDKMYILGNDTSNAIGRDDIGLVLLDPDDGGVVMVANFNETNLLTYMVWLTAFLLKHHNVVWMPENAFNAQPIIDYVVAKLMDADVNPFKRIYNQVYQNKDNDDRTRARYLEVTTNHYRKMVDKYRATFGFKTNSDTRGQLYGNVLINAAKNSGTLVKDQPLVQQIMNLRIKNNRVDHGNDGHDDLVIAWLLPQWLLYNGRSLADYGLVVTKILASKPGDSINKELSSEQRLAMQERERTEAEIDRLQEDLEDELDPRKIIQIANKLKQLMSRVGDESTAYKTIDEAMTSGHRDNKLKQRLNSRSGKLWN